MYNPYPLLLPDYENIERQSPYWLVHAIIKNFAFTQFFTIHSFIYSWAFLVRYDAANMISTKMAKKNFTGTDVGKRLSSSNLFTLGFVMSW
jgi:hypothetical protein